MGNVFYLFNFWQIHAILVMKKPRSKLANWLSFNQHRKRFGSSSVVKSMSGASYEDLKNTQVSAGEVRVTHGSKKELKAHMDDLRQEFSGQPEINYYHAQLIVLIRRGVDVRKHMAELERLWSLERGFLLGSLSTRWLISAADTFIDHSEDLAGKALLMNAVILINTIKLQESERYLCKTEEAVVDPARKQSLQTERLALFDGVAGFAVGTDDTLRNMRWRLDRLCAEHPMGALVIEVFERVQRGGNVYARFRALHTRDRTAWWQD